MTPDEVIRTVLAALALYVLACGASRTRSTWRTVPSETRLLWLVLVTTAAASVFANVVGLALGIPVSPGAYASAVPLLIGAAVVTVPGRFRL